MSTISTTSIDIQSRREATRAERILRTRLEGFPQRRSLRWVLRVVFALPYIALAVVSDASGRILTGAPNSGLFGASIGFSWDTIDIHLLERLYPPITTILVSAVPGGRLGIAILGAFVAGAMLMRLLEIMVQRRFATGTLAILMIALAANPMFAYTAIENFEGMLCLALFGIGLADTVRFVAWNDTRAGFRAGLLFMGAVLSSPAGFIYVLIAIVTAPFLRLGRANQPGARSANVLILAYPSIAALLSFAFLELIFLGRPFGFLSYVIGGGQSALEIVTTLFTTFNGALVIAPVVSAWVIALIVRKPWAILISTLVFLGVVMSSVYGLLPTNSAGDTFILMVVMAIALIPTARQFPTVLLVDIVATAQIAIAWLAAFNRPIVLDWLQQLGLG